MDRACALRSSGFELVLSARRSRPAPENSRVCSPSPLVPPPPGSASCSSDEFACWACREMWSFLFGPPDLLRMRFSLIFQVLLRLATLDTGNQSSSHRLCPVPQALPRGRGGLMNGCRVER